MSIRNCGLFVQGFGTNAPRDGRLLAYHISDAIGESSSLLVVKFGNLPKRRDEEIVSSLLTSLCESKVLHTLVLDKAQGLEMEGVQVLADRALALKGSALTCTSILLAFYVMRCGALDSSDALLSCSITSPP